MSVLSGYKRQFPQELAILSKSGTQYVIQSPEKNANQKLAFRPIWSSIL